MRKTVIKNGYRRIYLPKNPGADTTGYVSYATHIVEQVLGKYLKAAVIIHHINGRKLDNQKQNFVACENESYHQFLHIRKRALEACGNVHWRLCEICGEYDDLKNLYDDPHRQRRYFHPECNALRSKRIYNGKKNRNIR